ncbi:diphosphoinositol-polyphosphate diphosphatase [Nematocida sp. AWRm80]|nr:diphosphoinositol-polyphosphate diphosphatase [Nematocida sp. AWRm80]
MKPWHSLILGIVVCAFVLWPVVLITKNKVGTAYTLGGKRKSKAVKNRLMVGCIPIYKGKVFLINGRKKKRFLLPKGGIDNGEVGYYAAGKEALEEVGLIGMIDKEPLVNENGMSWYLLEVTRVLDKWKEKNERIRQLMTIEDALMHSEVKGVTKTILKAALKAESKTKYPRMRLTVLDASNTPNISNISETSTTAPEPSIGGIEPKIISVDQSIKQ